MIDLVDVAENAFGLLPLGPGSKRESRDDLILVDQDGSADFRMALRNRFPLAELDARMAEVRAWFAAHGREDFSWWVGTGSTPGVLEALLARGAVPSDDEEYLAAMALDSEPPAVHGVDVRPVETWEDEQLSRRLFAEIFGMTDVPEGDRQWWETSRVRDRSRGFIAYVDGEPVARALSVVTDAGPIELIGGAVREEHRGRGLYRALVRARWDDAVRRGTPILVTQAGHLSRPILDRLGFRTLGEVRVLIDKAS